MTEKPFVTVKNLKHYYNAGSSQEVRAVDDVTFSIQKGETFGLVGESGSGKSTIGRVMVNLYRPTSGTIHISGRNIHELSTREQRLAFHKQVQMIFQDPYASLNPRMKVRDIIAEGIDIHRLASSSRERDERVNELLEIVGLNMAHGSRYPHEFSGGQRQRIGIARALAVEPDFIVCDEPISALDVSIQAQIINLLEKLQEERGLTYLFIAHDLSMVKYFSDRIGMMYHGKLVELADAEELYSHPQHPYTKSLLSAIPLPDPDYEKQRQRIVFDDAAISFQNELEEVSANHWVRPYRKEE